MLVKTFELLPNVCVTAKTETGRSYMDARFLYGKLQLWDLPDNEQQQLVAFVKALTQSTVSGVDWPTAGADIEVLEQARDWFMDLPKALFMRWLEALDEVDALPVDPDLVPPEYLPEEKKTTPE
jgi:hypothetical protein